PEVDARSRRRVVTLKQQNRRHLRQRLDHQHRRHNRSARKMTLKEFLADGDVFDSDQPAARFVLRNGIHERRRISITQAIQRLRDVDEHGASVYQKDFGVLSIIGRGFEGALRRSTMSRLRFLAVAFALGTVACGSDTTTPTTPTTPTTVTDTFAGTLTPNGGVTQTFTTAASGTITATLTTLAPNSTLIVGLALGTFNVNA